MMSTTFQPSSWSASLLWWPTATPPCCQIPTVKPLLWVVVVLLEKSVIRSSPFFRGLSRSEAWPLLYPLLSVHFSVLLFIKSLFLVVQNLFRAFKPLAVLSHIDDLSLNASCFLATFCQIMPVCSVLSFGFLFCTWCLYLIVSSWMPSFRGTISFNASSSLKSSLHAFFAQHLPAIYSCAPPVAEEAATTEVAALDVNNLIATFVELNAHLTNIPACALRSPDETSCLKYPRFVATQITPPVPSPTPPTTFSRKKTQQ